LQQFLNLLVFPLGQILRLGFFITGNYGLAILFFALAAKVITFPLTLLAQKNSIRLIQMQSELDHIKRVHYGDKNRINEEQYELYKRERYSPLSGLLPLLVQLALLIGMINVIYQPQNHITSLTANDLIFLGTDLSITPSRNNLYALVLLPLLSGLSSYLLCLIQNQINPAQRRMRFWDKWGMSIILIAFSIYFPIVMQAAVGLYWFYSNTLSIAVAFCANAVYNPKKLVAVQLLVPPPKISREERLQQKILRQKQTELENASIKRFYSQDNSDKLVFYSVIEGHYKYFSEIIDYLLANTEIVVHYVTNDFNDKLLTQKRDRLEVYYISEKRAITFMLKLKAKMVVMTAPNLQQYHIKRSVVCTDIEYVFTYHHFTSLMLLREGALDHFDTVFCVGKHQIEEIRLTEQLYRLPQKKLVKVGYGQIDKLLRMYSAMQITESKSPRILIAPSWSERNILDSHLDEIVKHLAENNKLIVRPHPEYIRRFPEKWQIIMNKYNSENILIDMDFLSNDSIYQSDILITDWSNIAYEFSYCTKKPTIYVNTPMKIMNSEYFKLGIEPLDITLRGKLGVAVDIDKLNSLPGIITDMRNNPEKYRRSIESAIAEYLFYPGRSGEAAGKYIMSQFYHVL
jgi:YidC/Oxa1 family membrane protein insertase